MFSGAAAGLGGGMLLNGAAFRLRDQIANDFGWHGLLVALVARLNPMAVLPVAFFFAMVRTGGGFLTATGVSRTVTDAVQAIFVVAALLPAALMFVRDRRVARRMALRSVSPRRAMIGNIETVLEPTVRLGILLLFAALGEYVAERAGTINISLEGMMLGGAYGAALVSSLTGSPVVGILAGMAAGLIVAYIQAQLSHRLDIDQFVVGIALTTLVVGLTTFLFIEVEMTSGRLHEFRIPGLAEIPIIGEAFFGQVWLTYLIVPRHPRRPLGDDAHLVGTRVASRRREPGSGRRQRGAGAAATATVDLRVRAARGASRAPTWPSAWSVGSPST